MPHYIVITGGVLSGLGKGTVTASIGKLLKSQGFNVTAVKIDPYINIDAGTMRPTEHGEVFVTEDGGETDQDLGTYERFLNTNIGKYHNITTGQVYETVIHKERNLEFGGRCVEVIPHIPQEVERRIKDVANKTKADFILIEVGGTIGDYQNVLFLEATREMKLKGDKILFVHVAYLPIPKSLGEMKTKPAQHSVRDLNQAGIQPDIIICRAEKPIDDVRREKIALFCNVNKDDVISDYDVDSIYQISLMFEDQKLDEKILNKFNLPHKKGKLKEWRDFVERSLKHKREVKVGIVGKYFDIGDFTLEDSYISVIEAVKHAAWNNGVKPVIQWIDSKEFEKNSKNLIKLRNYDAIIVPGGFGISGTEGKIAAIRYCRENNIPFLGLCLGMQLAVIEFARNVCKLKGANSTEINKKTRYPVIDILPEQKKKLAKKQYGATMRLGAWPAKLRKGSLIYKLYNKNLVYERHRHRYEVNPKYIRLLESKGLIFSGVSPSRRLMEFMELKKHRYFVATQSHPCFKSRPTRPAPLFNGLIKAAIQKI